MQSLLLTVPLVMIAACGGGDDDGDSGTDADTTTDATTVTTIATASSTIEPAPTPTPMPTSDVDLDCEDVPDPNNYPDGVRPPAIRPCELPDELVISIVREGSGRPAEPGDTVVAHYIGIRSEDGAEFDSSYSRDQPLDFILGTGSVIAGWDQGFAGVQAGGIRKLDIPADLAYGDSPPGGIIEPGDSLTFVVHVQAVVPPVTIDDAPFDIDIPTSEGATEVTTIDIVEGEGAELAEGDIAIAHLLLVRGDNQVILHNSWETNDPLQIILVEGNSIPGLLEGMTGMAVGGQRIIVMPPDDAFGPNGEPTLGLPAGTDLIAVVEVVGSY